MMSKYVSTVKKRLYSARI